MNRLNRENPLRRGDNSQDAFEELQLVFHELQQLELSAEATHLIKRGLTILAKLSFIPDLLDIASQYRGLIWRDCDAMVSAIQKHEQAKIDVLFELAEISVDRHDPRTVEQIAVEEVKTERTRELILQSASKITDAESRLTELRDILDAAHASHG